jgi:hypothetical protein
MTTRRCPLTCEYHAQGQWTRSLLRLIAAPVARQSGPKSRKAKKDRANACLKGLLHQAANGAARIDTVAEQRDPVELLVRRASGT